MTITNDLSYSHEWRLAAVTQTRNQIHYEADLIGPNGHRVLVYAPTEHELTEAAAVILEQLNFRQVGHYGPVGNPTARPQ